MVGVLLAGSTTFTVVNDQLTIMLRRLQSEGTDLWAVGSGDSQLRLVAENLPHLSVGSAIDFADFLYLSSGFGTDLKRSKPALG